MIAEGPFTCRVFCALKFIISNVDVRQAAHNRRFFMKYMLAIGQHESLSLAKGLMQMFRQAVENRFAGDARCSRKNLKIENRMPTHRTNIRMIEYSGPALAECM